MGHEPPLAPQGVERESVDSGLASLVLLLAFHGRPADAEQIRRERGRGDDPFDADDIVRAARRLQVRARQVSAGIDDLAAMPLPAIARGSDGAFFILGKVDAGGPDGAPTALIQRADASAPEIWDQAMLEASFGGSLILLTTREQIAGDSRRFDISWFIPALVKYRAALRDVFLASFVLQVIALATPLFFQLLIDKVLAHDAMTTLAVLAFALLVVSLWEVVLGGLRTWLFAHTTARVDAELGAQMFRHLLSLPLAYFESRRVGDSVARVRELETIRDFLTSNAITLILDIFFTLIFFAVMLLYSPLLTLIVLLSIPAYVAISAFITPPLRRRLDEKFARGADNQAFLVESVSAVRTLKSMAVEPQMREKWERQIAGYTSTSFAVTQLANWGGQLVQFVSKLTMIALLYFGARQVMSGTMSVGALVAFNMLSSHVSGPILRLAQLWQNFQQVRISIDRLGDILNSRPEPQHDPTKAVLPPIAGRIAFDRVRFRYRPDSPEVLHEMSFDVAAGEMIGIVGPSGSGKSTLTKLVQRLYVATSGRVLVDGTDLTLVDPAWLRRQMGVVLQENELLNRSVRDNIALADPAAPMERVIAAAQMAGAHDFILELPHAYDTAIEERGANLSGGQRQRIAIARALLCDPRILILDEATSALDAESEAVIQRNLQAIAAGRTVIIIAHRLSAVRQCHRIMTVEGGTITEMGDHDGLLAANGRYAALFRSQMGLGGGAA
ncbi:type I secretion system permease/ATPase [Sphingobium sp. CAP-1]|uniref:type I secretion system permease/ATPase n=1 Tax=Sphingobium sp. CAP-1 TaxID=2676077 RepID=UPI0012BB2AAF|nr:type I secretion system permease/ATPase [Sphingobium sp. CAP-1]QGP79729.1 type I secretion system permease/ATPase [Sphingobium sp. CAP-1]